MLEVEISGLKFRNPLLLASGVLGTSAASMLRAVRCGAGGVVTKSTGIEPREGHPMPCVVELPYGLVNAMGLPNPGCYEFREEIRKFKEQCDAPIIASIFGKDPSEVRKVAEVLRDADAFEINVSCPHSDVTKRLEDDPEEIRRIVREVKRGARSPVWVKLSPNVSSIVEIGLAAQEGGADAVVAINTIRAMVIDIETGVPVLGNKVGGLSGRCIKPIAVRCIYELYEALDIPIIGVGGVSSHEDVIEMMLAGASAVEIGTAVMKDIRIFEKIKMGLEEYLKRKELKLEELVGKAHRV